MFDRRAFQMAQKTVPVAANRALPSIAASAGLSFAFFTALARDYMDIIPESVAARALVGGHLILSIGWGLVVFAAVMSYIQPQIERISLREKTASHDQGSP